MPHQVDLLFEVKRFFHHISLLNSSLASPIDDETVGNLSTEEIHVDETGIKVEVVSEDGQPRKILIHIPDGRIVELGCEY